MMEKEYIFHKETTKELQQTAKRLQINIRNLRNELEEIEEKDTDHARKGLRQSQVSHSLLQTFCTVNS